MLFGIINGPSNAHKRDELQTKVRDSIGRFWNNATFTFLFNKFEKKIRNLEKR
jgi:hypothetical protein